MLAVSSSISIIITIIRQIDNQGLLHTFLLPLFFNKELNLDYFSDKEIKI